MQPMPLVAVAALEDTVAKHSWIEDRGGRRPHQVLSSPSAPRERSGNRLAFLQKLRGRCFRCLAQDHFVSACRDPVRCLSCLCSGHQQRDCRRHLPARQDSRRPSPPDCLMPRSWASVVAPSAMPEKLLVPEVLVEPAASGGGD
ncbi:hypothetical protein BRADI_4g20761v3 [Brachypodium distachyon]|uniref:CCHC-type domain-containing protein n=1 Tax=Brachypodium distachyon TaxID=15368 RepID=A0A0Q3HKB3_BRADI|nr:hypothetical protein BRADI_4g20761v3 [Brachypodium distachyon]